MIKTTMKPQKEKRVQGERGRVVVRRGWEDEDFRGDVRRRGGRLLVEEGDEREKDEKKEME